MIFLKIRDLYLKSYIDIKYENVIYGLDGETETYSDPG